MYAQDWLLEWLVEALIKAEGCVIALILSFPEQGPRSGPGDVRIQFLPQ